MKMLLHQAYYSLFQFLGGVFANLTMDFVEGLPKSQGRNVVLAVVNKLTKCAHFMGLPHPFFVQPVTQLFLDRVYKLHGNPHTITSDRGVVLLSKFWQELF